jgi:hypothetical protein
MNNIIRWFAVDKEDLLDVLLGEAPPNGPSHSTPPLPALKAGKLAFGYRVWGLEAMPEKCGPALVIVDDTSAIETMSWLRAIAYEAFPMSQFARVVKLSDWDMFSPRKDDLSRIKDCSLARWASVSVGEVLAQSESDIDLTNLPLSRLASSLTLPVGRTTYLFGRDDSTQLCVNRLRTVSEDTRFVRKQVTVSELTPIWALCSANIGTSLQADESALIVVEAAHKFIRDQAGQQLIEGAHFIELHVGLQSDSAEERVVAFNHFSEDVLRLSPSQLASSGAVMLAAAAFMVGRSTTHAFLLNRFRRTAPSSFAWFGLIAAFAGSRCWDGAWLRAVKGAERLLKPRFDWIDTSPADIGWTEFAWLAGSVDNVEHLLELPKMLPRTLGVEVVPGVALQVRLGQGSVSDEPRVTAEISAREQALMDAINKILEVATQVGGLDVLREIPMSGRTMKRGQQSQQSLELENPPTVTKVKSTRVKKPKRNDKGI